MAMRQVFRCPAYMVVGVLLICQPLKATAAYMTGKYWQLGDGDYRYSVTAWNNEPRDWKAVWGIRVYTDPPVFDITGPPGWQYLSVGDAAWSNLVDPIEPGEWLGGFAFTDHTQWEGLPYVLVGVKDRGWVEFELVPEPGFAFPAATLLLGAAAFLRRRVR